MSVSNNFELSNKNPHVFMTEHEWIRKYEPKKVYQITDQIIAHEKAFERLKENVIQIGTVGSLSVVVLCLFIYWISSARSYHMINKLGMLGTCYAAASTVCMASLGALGIRNALVLRTLGTKLHEDKTVKKDRTEALVKLADKLRRRCSAEAIKEQLARAEEIERIISSSVSDNNNK